MRRAILMLMALLAAPAFGQVNVKTYPPGAAAAGGGGIPTFPILAPCGAIGAPSYSFTGGSGEMGMWCSAPDPSGIVVIQNRYDVGGTTQPNLEGRSRLSLGLEFWSLNAVRVEDDDFMSIQGFDEGGGVPKVRIDVTDDAVTGSYSFFEDRFESTERIFGQVQAACTINQISYGFVGDNDTGLCSQSANRVGLYSGAAETFRSTTSETRIQTSSGLDNASVVLTNTFPNGTFGITDDAADLVLGLQLLGSQDEGRLVGLDFTTGDETRLSFQKNYFDVGFDDALPITDAVKSAMRLDYVSSSRTTVTLGADAVLIFTSIALASLGTPADGTLAYCSDCTKGSTPCTGASTGSFAKRENGAWNCD